MADETGFYVDNLSLNDGVDSTAFETGVILARAGYNPDLVYMQGEQCDHFRDVPLLAREIP
mgnify:CR=1 FL=1